MSYARVVWFEKGREIEDVVPSKWINGSTIKFPRKDSKQKIVERTAPNNYWLSFQMKVKARSESCIFHSLLNRILKALHRMLITWLQLHKMWS
jgi:hypothetical protein